jgi:hypothetical protein
MESRCDRPLGGIYSYRREERPYWNADKYQSCPAVTPRAQDQAEGDKNPDITREYVLSFAGIPNGLEKYGCFASPPQNRIESTSLHWSIAYLLTLKK